MSNTEIDTEALIKKLNAIMHKVIDLIKTDTRNTNPQSTMAALHDIYVESRNCRDMLTFDAVSRAVMRRLAGEEAYFICGFKTPNTLLVYVRECVKNARKIEGIKEVRAITGLGLKEAKDVYEQIEARYMSSDPPVVD